jgi:hypothetical protein
MAALLVFVTVALIVAAFAASLLINHRSRSGETRAGDLFRYLGTRA